MSENVTRRRFLGAAAALAAPALIPSSVFGRTKETLSPDLVRKVDRYWAGYFGCSPQDLVEAKTTVVQHEALSLYEDVLVLRNAASCVISVPSSVPEMMQATLRAAGPSEAFDLQFLSKVFRVAPPQRIVGPGGLDIADLAGFNPVRSNARLLEDADRPAIERLAGNCGESIWSRSRLLPSRGRLFGLFEGSELTAAAGYIVAGDTLAVLAVVIHPAHRGHGLAKKVLTAATEDAFENGLIPLWRTPAGHPPVAALGRSLGFRPYASVIVVQLVEGEF